MEVEELTELDPTKTMSIYELVFPVVPVEAPVAVSEVVADG